MPPTFVILVLAAILATMAISGAQEERSGLPVAVRKALLADAARRHRLFQAVDRALDHRRRKQAEEGNPTASAFVPLQISPVDSRPSSLASTSSSSEAPQPLYWVSLKSGSSVGTGEYFASVRVGTPPQELSLVLDTGSDLTWVKCENGSGNSGQVFRPAESASFQLISCMDPQCRLAATPPYCKGGPPGRGTTCKYEYSYSDRSASAGEVALENVTLAGENGTVAMFLGCAHHSSGETLSTEGGVLALGQGPLSFLSQIKRRKFSYCLMGMFSPPNVTSLLAFGDSPIAATSLLPVQLTPLLQNSRLETFYYVSLRSVKVGSEPLPITPQQWEIKQLTGYGGTIIDSGSTLASFPDDIFQAFYNAFEALVPYPRAPPTHGLELCYNVTSLPAPPTFPPLLLTFAGNAVMAPPQENYFTPTKDNLYCLAMARSTADSRVSVLGNLLQQNYFVEFDLSQGLLGFAPANCSAFFHS